MRQGLIDKGRACFEAAAKYLSPEDGESTTNLGVGWFFRGDLDKAIALLEQALDMDSSFVPARYHLGLAYLHQGRYEEAIAAFESVVASEPNPRGPPAAQWSLDGADRSQCQR
jgi:tetratricopeptide (TPR) repeat protein